MALWNRGRRARRLSSYNPSADQLEPKHLLYATLGHDWAVAPGSRITYSFAPDGTFAGGNTSSLFQTMANKGFSQQQWQDQFRRAAGIWQTVAGINLVEVPDNGSALGVAGKQQGDTRFGDIRIFGVPTGPGTLAYAFLPPPANGGTRAGDMVFGTDQLWNINTTVDLQTVAIHEFGHALGLGHSSLASSVMYAGYNGVKQTLTADDVAGMRAVYGARTQDMFDAWRNNQEPTGATPLNGWLTYAGQTSLNQLDITNANDNDWYYVQAPANASGTMRITVQSTGLSSLSPRLQVYNSALQLAGWTVPPNASTTYGGTVTLNFSGVGPGTGIYIRVLGWNGASSGPNGTGQYALQADFSGNWNIAPALPTSIVINEQPDQGGGALPETFEMGEPGSAWFNRRMTPVSSRAATPVGLGLEAGDWDANLPQTPPATEGTILAFPGMEQDGRVPSARGARLAQESIAHLALLDTLLETPVASWLWESNVEDDGEPPRGIAADLAERVRFVLEA